MQNEYVMWAVKVGEPDWAEQIITTNRAKAAEAKAWATANGFDRFREAVVELERSAGLSKGDSIGNRAAVGSHTRSRTAVP